MKADLHTLFGYDTCSPRRMGTGKGRQTVVDKMWKERAVWGEGGCGGRGLGMGNGGPEDQPCIREV